MNQYPLMRIQGRNVIKIQHRLNNGLCKIYSKTSHPKRQCNVAFNLVLAKNELPMVRKKEAEDIIKKKNEEELRKETLRKKYDEQIKALKDIRESFGKYISVRVGGESIYNFIERVCSYSRSLIYKDAGFNRINSYIIKNVKQLHDRVIIK